MRITGILAPSGTPDDDAAFVDLKTAWLIDGLAHGHDDLTRAPTDQILTHTDTNVVGNASVRLYNEVTPSNFASFHFHGDPKTYPLTAALVFPNDPKSDTLLSGRYQEKKTTQTLQLIAPEPWITSLMSTLFRLESLILILLIATGTAGLLIITLVFALSFRLRRREFHTLEDLGIAPSSLLTVKLFEILLVGLGDLFFTFLYPSFPFPASFSNFFRGRAAKVRRFGQGEGDKRIPAVVVLLLRWSWDNCILGRRFVRYRFVIMSLVSIYSQLSLLLISSYRLVQ
jgi:putative ABC transport system permease protein